MRDPPPVVGAFDARDIARLTGAFDAALLIARDEGSPFLAIPERDLRAWIARCLLAAMRRGIRDSHVLTAIALRDLHHLVAHQEDGMLRPIVPQESRRPTP